MLLGNVVDMTISEIWNGEHSRIRKSQVNGVFDGICRKCETATATKLPEFQSNLYPATYYK